MRVAYVCADAGVPVFGQKGCSVHVQEVIRAMTSLGLQVDLIAARGLDAVRPAGLENIRAHALPTIDADNPAAREQLARDANAALRRTLEHLGPFDAVYERHSLWSVASMAFARDHGIPGILEVNAPLIDEQAEYRTLCDRDAAQRAATAAFGAAPTIVAVSDGVAAYVRRFTGATARLHVVPNGVDPVRFARAVSLRPVIGSKIFTIGFVGTLKPWHGLPVLVDAFAEVHAANPQTHLLVVGDGPERSKMEACLSARGLRHASIFTGAVAPADIPSLLSSMDAAVAPYPAGDAFYFSPLKVLEYMAAGLPVVASRIGQLEELIVDGQTGVLCAPGDARALAASLIRLGDDPVLRLRLGTAARSAVARDRTWLNTARRIFTLAGVNISHVGTTGAPAELAKAVAT
jgi:glycosyltransferase involved in cell wall biosynthesis